MLHLIRDIERQCLDGRGRIDASRGHTGLWESAGQALSWITLLLSILMMVQLLFVKQILEDHLSSAFNELPLQRIASADLSWVLTFFFHIFYLQHVINSQVLSNRPVGGA